MNDQPHSHEPHEHAAPEAQMDAGSQALAEALRASFTIVKFAMVLLVVVFLASGFFTVGPQERAVILRFGKPVGEGEKALLKDGLHWSLPYPIDDVQKIPITEIQKITSSVGWFFTTPEMELTGAEPGGSPSLNPATEGYVLTADGNIVHARATLRYHISDPIRYVFDFTNAAVVVQSALDNALLATAARFKVDDILVRNKVGFSEEVQRRVTALLETRHVGVSVENCIVESRAPLYLKADFENVLKAELNRSKMLDDARTEANAILAKATGDAAARINIAESDRNELIKSTIASAAQFNELLPIYQRDPGLFLQVYFYPRLGRALAGVQEKFMEPMSSGGKSVQNRILINREPLKPRTEANQ